MAYGDFESVTVAGTAIGFTAGNYKEATATGLVAKKAKGVFCTLEGGQIRYRADGTDPTAAVGHIMNAGDILTINDYDEIRRFKAIRTGANSGTLRVSYEF